MAAIAAFWSATVWGTGSETGAGGAPGVSPQVTGSLRSTPRGIEGDDVEVIEQLAGEHAELIGKVVDPRHAGTAGVDDQRADPLGRIFGQVPLQGDANCRPLGRGVVERNGERSALQIAVARRPDNGRDRQGRRCRRCRGRCGRSALSPGRGARRPGIGGAAGQEECGGGPAKMPRQATEGERTCTNSA